MVLYGDLLFRSYMLGDLMNAEGDLVVVVDSNHRGGGRDLAYCDAEDDRAFYRQRVLLEQISDQAGWRQRAPSGRWIGMLRCRGRGARVLRETLEALSGQDDFDRLGMPELLNRLVADGQPVQVIYVNGRWLDLNNLHDLQRAGVFAEGDPAP